MQQKVAVKISSAEEEGANDNISSVEIKELFFYWSRTQIIVKKCHLNKAVVNKSINFGLGVFGGGSGKQKCERPLDYYHFDGLEFPPKFHINRLKIIDSRTLLDNHFVSRFVIDYLMYAFQTVRRSLS